MTILKSKTSRAIFTVSRRLPCRQARTNEYNCATQGALR
jgi:hypothetical protein